MVLKSGLMSALEVAQFDMTSQSALFNDSDSFFASGCSEGEEPGHIGEAQGKSIFTSFASIPYNSHSILTTQPDRIAVSKISIDLQP